MTTRCMVLALTVAAAVSGCDNRAAFHEPDPALARMLSQRRADPWDGTTAFPDGKVMQPPPPGAVPADDETGTTVPPVTRAHLELGRERFNVVCAVCHGIVGTGQSVVATKMELRPPPSLVDPESRARDERWVHDAVTKGYGLMPSYADMLGHEERWAVARYVQALRLSREARIAALPPALRDQAQKELR